MHSSTVITMVLAGLGALCLPLRADIPGELSAERVPGGVALQERGRSSAMTMHTIAAGPTSQFLPQSSTPEWGFVQGIRVALHPAAIGGAPGDGGPRGLLRIGYPILPDGQCSLVNFIAVEPTVAGRKGFSELEPSSVDGRPGKVFTFSTIREDQTRDGASRQRIRVNVEKFENGAHVYLEITFLSNRPEEVVLRAFAEKDSAPIQECVLTATMGNYERLREVWLQGGPVNSRDLYAHYTGNDFARDVFYPLNRLAVDSRGDVVVQAAPDEADPRLSQDSLPPNSHWRYPGVKVTQYWRVPKGAFSPYLRLRLNGRRVYWRSEIPLPGGPAFENFELRDRFRSGEPFIFGITTRSPAGREL